MCFHLKIVKSIILIAIIVFLSGCGFKRYHVITYSGNIKPRTEISYFWPQGYSLRLKSIDGIECCSSEINKLNTFSGKWNKK